jgi:hypothetical protein
MKIYKTISLAAITMLLAVSASAQTADDIIGNHLKAIGGKDLLTKIKSVYTENTMDVMGMQITTRSTILNGKGMRQDMDVQGSAMVTCINDKEGWTINPMMGSGSAETMPESQYNSGKNQIVIGAPFVNYAEKGYKAELMGTEAVGSVKAFKIKMTAPDNMEATYFFDPGTHYLLKSVQQQDMQGQLVENIISFSDYRQTDGYYIPFKTSMDIAGGQFTMDMTVTKVELNKPVDEKIFARPQ